MHTDILISGGGMVGLSLALAVAPLGLQITVLEPTPFEAHVLPKFDGRVSAIALGSKHLLQNIGAWQHMSAEAEPITDIRVSENGRDALHYDHREVGNEPFGWIVENRHIRAALLTALAQHSNVELRAPTAAVDWRPGAVVLKSGETLQASLIITAEGKNSALREAANIPYDTLDYPHGAIVCTIAHSQPHRGVAEEKFFAAGPFAVLPMTRNRSSLVWTEAKEHLPHFLGLPEAEFVEEIRERVGEHLGEISLEGNRFAYPLQAQLARRYTAPRLALIGDAAHAIHPVAGQGVNLGFRDVAVLAELIARHARLGLDIGDPALLSHYERWRRLDNFSMLAVTDGLTRLFMNPLLPVKLARRAGLAAVAHLPPLKRFFMRHAMGLTGDLPPLMRAA